MSDNDTQPPDPNAARPIAADESSLSFYRDIVESLDDAVCRWLPDTTLTYCNARYRELFGIGGEDGDGRKWLEFVPPAQRATLIGFYDALAREPRAVTYEHEVTTADGSLRWLSWRDVPLRDAVGALVGFQSVGRDITALKRAERALLESSARLNEAQRMASIGSWELDLTTWRLTWSDEVFRIFEIDPAKFGARYDAFLALIHPDDRERVRHAYSESVANRTPYELLHRLQMADGRIKWVRERCETFYDEQGSAVRSAGTVQDVTRQVLAEHESKRAHELLQFIIDACPDWIFAKDLNHRFMVVNRAFARAQGLAPEQMIGRADTEFWSRAQCEGDPAAGLRGFHNDDRRAFAGATVHHAHDVATLRDGSRRILDAYKGPLKDANGRIIGVFSYQRDVTDRVNVERELEASRAHLRAIVESEPECVKLLDRNGNVLDMNPAGLAMIEADTLGEVRGRCVCPLVSAHDRAEFDAMLAAVFRGESFRLSFEITGLKGGRRHLETHAAPLWDEERRTVKALLGVTRDVTERRRVEEELRQHRERLEELVQKRTRHLQAAKNEAERANKAKSEFLSRMSHELRTPMNAILGFAQVLEMERLDPRHRRFVEEIHRAGDHLLRLIDDLLDISRIEAGKVTVAVQPTPLHAVVAEALQIVQPLLARRGLTLKDLCQASAHVHVMADPVRLRQILVNLLSNAAKYNRDGGAVALDCRPAGARRIRMVVIDTGPGIAPHRLPRLFEPFERLGAESTAVEGTGIGLALSRQLAQLMGAELGVESTLGVGSTFWIDLPAAEAAPQRGEDTARAPRAAEGEATVLYVEDNLANLRVVEALLGLRPGLRMLSAADGEDGLRIARRERPDVIVLDIHLPALDGYAILALLRADPATRAIPVIALSADAMPGDIERGLQAGFEHYLTKPVRADQLNAAIESGLRRRGAARPVST